MSARESAYVSFPAGIVLPYYYDVSLADRDSIGIAGNANIAAWKYTNKTNNVEIPMFLFFIITTDATAGNRLWRFQFQGADGSLKAVLIPPMVQPPSAQFVFYMSQGLNSTSTQSAIVGAITAGQLNMSIPPLEMYPGDTITVNPTNNAAGDVIGNGIISRISVPTSGEGDGSSPFPFSIPAEQLA